MCCLDTGDGIEVPGVWRFERLNAWLPGIVDP
jgi:hypothetical protein